MESKIRTQRHFGESRIYEIIKFQTIYFILPVLVWFGGIFLSCSGGGDLLMGDGKSNEIPAKEFNMPFACVIVELRVDSLVEEHEEGKKQHSIAQARAALFLDLGSTAYRVNRVYETIPFVALEVSPAALQALKKSAFVAGIAEDTLSSTQSK